MNLDRQHCELGSAGTAPNALRQDEYRDWESLAHGPGSESQAAFSRKFCAALAEAGLKAGADDYIPKDVFATTVLIETIRQMGLI